MLPNLQNRIVKKTRHWGRKGGKMGTKQLNNKKSHNRIHSGEKMSCKSLHDNGLQIISDLFPSRVYRETLINPCCKSIYINTNVHFLLSPPSTFLPSSTVGNRLEIGNRILKISQSDPVTIDHNLAGNSTYNNSTIDSEYPVGNPIESRPYINLISPQPDPELSTIWPKPGPHSSCFQNQIPV